MLVKIVHLDIITIKKDKLHVLLVVREPLIQIQDPKLHLLVNHVQLDITMKILVNQLVLLAEKVNLIQIKDLKLHLLVKIV